MFAVIANYSMCVNHTLQVTAKIKYYNFRKLPSAYSKLVWSHKGNKAATNGSALLLVGVPTPDQFSNWSKTPSQGGLRCDFLVNWRISKEKIDSACLQYIQATTLGTTKCAG